MLGTHTRIMVNRLLLAAASLFALGEFAMLLVACLAQFEPGFSTEEAMGSIGLAFFSSILATVFALGAYLASRQNPWAVRLAVSVWAGFGAFIVLGLVLHEFAIAGLRR